MEQVLIIDDDRELCALMKKCVEQENLSAAAAYSGREGLRLLAGSGKACSLVVLDVMLPDMGKAGMSYAEAAAPRPRELFCAFPRRPRRSALYGGRGRFAFSGRKGRACPLREGRLPFESSRSPSG